MSDFYLEPLDKLMIDHRAACIANDENPDYEGRLIDIIEDRHVEAAIREYFADCDGWTEDLMPQAMELYRRTDRMEKAAKDLARTFLGDLVHGVL